MSIFEVFSSPYYSLGEKKITIFAYCLALLTAFVIHEFSHSYVAVKMGDNTPKYNGRLTLNPVAHIDPVGQNRFEGEGRPHPASIWIWYAAQQ